eukprot:gene14685-biopygen8745
MATLMPLAAQLAAKRGGMAAKLAASIPGAKKAKLSALIRWLAGRGARQEVCRVKGDWRPDTRAEHTGNASGGKAWRHGGKDASLAAKDNFVTSHIRTLPAEQLAEMRLVILLGGTNNLRKRGVANAVHFVSEAMEVVARLCPQAWSSARNAASQFRAPRKEGLCSVLSALCSRLQESYVLCALCSRSLARKATSS